MTERTPSPEEITRGGFLLTNRLVTEPAASGVEERRVLQLFFLFRNRVWRIHRTTEHGDQVMGSAANRVIYQEEP
jgi:hypothetical protein